MRFKDEVASDYIQYLLNNGYDEAINLSVADALGLLTRQLYKLEKLCLTCYLKKIEDPKLPWITHDANIIKCDVCGSELQDTKNFQWVSATSAFWHMCEFVVHRDPKSRKRVWNPFIKELYEILEFNKLSALMAPRGHGKSFLAFVLYPIFKAWLWEYFECILACNIPKMAKRNLRITKINIDENEFLLDKKDVEGVRIKKTQWGNDVISYNKGIIETLGVGTTPKSAHVHYVLVDDPLRDDRKYPDSKIENFVLAELLPCIQRMKGRMAVLGTPVHGADIFHVVMNTKKDHLKGKLITQGQISAKKFYSKVFDAIVDGKKKISLLPDILSYDELMSLKDTQGEYKFNREYRCKCTDDKNALFSWTLLRSSTDDIWTWQERPRDLNANYVVGIDVAESGTASADFFGAVFLQILELTERHERAGIGLRGERIKVIRHIIHGKLGDVEAERQIKNASKLFNQAFVLCEENNVGAHMIKYWERMGVNIQAFRTDRIKRQTGVRFLQQEMKTGHLFFCATPEEGEAREHMISLKNELMNFGPRPKNTASGTIEVLRALSGHDDLVDALWIANQATELVQGRKIHAIGAKIYEPVQKKQLPIHVLRMLGQA